MTKSIDKTLFHVQARSQQGKKTSVLRSQGLVPANIYGQSKESQAIQMNASNFRRLYQDEGDTGLIFLKVDEANKEIPVLVDDVQVNPVDGRLLHVVFRQVNLAEKIEAEVPIELVGENKTPDTNVVQVRDSLIVTALPADLPENFEVDISVLTEVGQTITIADLKYDTSKVGLVLTGEINESDPVVILQEVKEEVEEEVTEEAGEAEDAAAASADEGGGKADQDKAE
jgi:large subunit ribosomal protein L25